MPTSLWRGRELGVAAAGQRGRAFGCGARAHDTFRSRMPPFPRFRCALPVTLRRRSGDVELLTADASYRDVFVRTDAAPPERSLVRLDLSLPPDDTILSVSASVDAVIAATLAAESYPGFLARFVGLSGQPKDRWDGFIAGIARSGPAARDTTAVFARPSYVERFTERTTLRVSLRYAPTDVGALAELATVASAGGRMQVPTAMAIIPGAPVDVEVVHPLTEDVALIHGTVTRRDSSAPSVEVRFDPLDPSAARGLREFADTVAIVEEYDVDILAAPALR